MNYTDNPPFYGGITIRPGYVVSGTDDVVSLSLLYEYCRSVSRAAGLVLKSLWVFLQVIHSYIVWLLVRILRNQLGFYEPSYRLYVVLLFSLSVVILLTGLLDIAAHIAGSILACRYLLSGNKSKADRSHGSNRHTPLLVYSQVESPTGSIKRPGPRGNGAATVGQSMRSSSSSSPPPRSPRSPPPW